MKHLVVAAALIAGIGPAAADKWDLSTMTCQQFLQSDKDTITVILTWLDGYYKDDDAPPVIDTDQFVRNAENLGRSARNLPASA